MNIIVLAGGLSPERNVSLTSGSLIASALRRRGHKVLLVDVYLADLDVISLVCYLLDRWGEHTAGAAPVGIKVDKHGSACTHYLFNKIFVRKLDNSHFDISFLINFL